ncbi:hypothetical protein GCM10022247_06710 [Allokutzneria multivorans]|uniref:Uncharacterized protein n=1 Tax=Allokutzneria multivorans TaxID=1142134 RepID=A0ABP7R066_9PSEU
MRGNAGRAALIAKQLIGVWLVGSLQAVVGGELLIIFLLLGLLPVAVVALAALAVGGFVLLSSVGRATAGASSMTADRERRLWWTLIVQVGGIAALYLTWTWDWYRELGGFWPVLRPGLPFVVLAAVLVLVPRKHTSTSTSPLSG